MEYLSITLSVVALVWIGLREIAPKTPTEIDDKLLNALDSVGEKLGVSPSMLRERFMQKERRRKQPK